jgi:hypothetical protein
VAKKDAAKGKTPAKGTGKDEEKAEPQTLPAVSEEELKRRHERWLTGAAIVKSLGNTLIIGICAVAVSLFTFYLPVLASHGETTVISLTQKWLADVNMSLWVSWAATAAAGTAAYRYRNKLVKERRTKDARISELEKAIDPKRTSSGLLPDGRMTQ